MDDENKFDNLLNNDLNNMIIEYSYKSMESYVGTGIYRAPELENKSHELEQNKYYSKIDIYSLGIVLIELFINFKTQSEKIILITKLKKNSDINSNLLLLNSIDNNKLKKLILNLISSNPNDRPRLEIILSQLYDCIQDL